MQRLFLDGFQRIHRAGIAAGTLAAGTHNGTVAFDKLGLGHNFDAATLVVILDGATTAATSVELQIEHRDLPTDAWADATLSRPGDPAVSKTYGPAVTGDELPLVNPSVATEGRIMLYSIPLKHLKRYFRPVLIGVGGDTGLEYAFIQFYDVRSEAPLPEMAAEW